MATTITTADGIEWNVNKGVVAGDEALEPTPDENSATGSVNPVEFQWEDAVARLIEGPEQLTGFYVEGRPYLDTRTIVTDDETGDVTSDGVVRTYPAYNVIKMNLTSSITADWTDTTNPAKPKQNGGIIIYKQNDLDAPVAMLGGGYSRVGMHDWNAWSYGFVLNKASLPTVSPNSETFLIDLETGRGYMWTDARPGAAAPGFVWANTGLAKNPTLINTAALGSIDELDENADVGAWQVVNTGVYGTVYAKTDSGWLNIGPIQAGGNFPIVTVDPVKVYVSGYMYGQVFDQSDFRYVPRMSGETQNSYQGEVSLRETGWFPTVPLDVDRDIYPMDSITKVKPDGRKSVTVTYNCTLETDLITGSCTIIQDVYQPTYNWGELIQQLLELTYFKHGIYH